MNAPIGARERTEPQIVTFTPGMRRLIADAIEALILLLDEIDGDADFEEDDPAEENGDLEPILGATHSIDQTIAWRATQSTILDSEPEHDGREPDADFEPNWVSRFSAD
ncbi:MAG: hypothetical protein ABSE69_20240 [Roseiarcus sp.]